MHRLILVLTFAAVAGGTALLASSRGPGEHAPAADELAAQQKQLQSLTLQVDSLRDSLLSLKAAPPGVGVGPVLAAPTAATPNGSALPEDEPHAIHEAPVPEPPDLETEFAHEPASGAAKEAEGQLAARLARVMPEGSHIEEIECRAAHCRVESSHHGVRGYREFLKATTGQASEIWQGSVRFEPLPVPDNPEADVVLVAYVSR